MASSKKTKSALNRQKKKTKKQPLKKKAAQSKAKPKAKKATSKAKPKAEEKNKASIKPKKEKLELPAAASPYENESEENKPKISFIDHIKASAQKINEDRKNDSDKDEDEYMDILATKRRGRPPKSGKKTRKSPNHIYEPEFDGLQEQPIIAHDERGASLMQDLDETIDIWTDDDIPMNKDWRQEITNI